MSYNPEGPIANQLKPLLVNELSTRYNIPDDASDVAEYINVLIGNQKTAAEIVGEVKELVDIPIDEQFINTVYGEIARLMGSVDQPQSEQSQHQQQQQEQQEQPQQQEQQLQSTPQQLQSTAQQFPQQPAAFFQPQQMNIPTKPRFSQGRDRDFTTRGNSVRGGRGGINKQQNGRHNKSFGMQNPENLEKVLALSNQNNVNFTPKPPKGRCKDFPYCSNRECAFAHPTRECFSYPNCPNPPGTCNYLHPDQDQELMAKLEKSKQEYLERRKLRMNGTPVVETSGTIGICKFGMLCSKELCPFGHPTPANKDARVIALEWCEAGKQCSDVTCKKAHPSPNYQAPPPEAPKPKSKPVVERTLEQCKFGLSCTNYNCPRRHATSTVPCREGANCQRIDCTFAHPIDEVCRFADKCSNKNCVFKHPETRAVQSNTWSKDGGNATTTERSFAVPDDQVMEHAAQEQTTN